MNVTMKLRSPYKARYFLTGWLIICFQDGLHHIYLVILISIFVASALTSSLRFCIVILYSVTTVQNRISAVSILLIYSLFDVLNSYPYDRYSLLFYTNLVRF
jgi:hypothetical protein